MKVNLFYTHTISERHRLVLQKGEFLSGICYKGFYMSLFLVEDQFVEVFYNIKRKSIEAVELADTEAKHFVLYAAGVDINDAFDN